MDAATLAGKMLLWGRMRRDLDELEAEITEAVLARHESVTVGDVRASYFGGRRIYAYDEAGKKAPKQIIRAHTTPHVDWRAVCLEAKLDPAWRQTDPSVTLKLLNGL